MTEKITPKEQNPQQKIQEVIELYNNGEFLNTEPENAEIKDIDKFLNPYRETLESLTSGLEKAGNNAEEIKKVREAITSERVKMTRKASEKFEIPFFRISKAANGLDDEYNDLSIEAGRKFAEAVMKKESPEGIEAFLNPYRETLESLTSGLEKAGNNAEEIKKVREAIMNKKIEMDKEAGEKFEISFFRISKAANGLAGEYNDLSIEAGRKFAEAKMDGTNKIDKDESANKSSAESKPAEKPGVLDDLRKGVNEQMEIALRGEMEATMAKLNNITENPGNHPNALQEIEEMTAQIMELAKQGTKLYDIDVSEEEIKDALGLPIVERDRLEKEITEARAKLPLFRARELLDAIQTTKMGSINWYDTAKKRVPDFFNRTNELLDTSGAIDKLETKLAEIKAEAEKPINKDTKNLLKLVGRNAVPPIVEAIDYKKSSGADVGHNMEKMLTELMELTFVKALEVKIGDIYDSQIHDLVVDEDPDKKTDKSLKIHKISFRGLELPSLDEAKGEYVDRLTLKPRVSIRYFPNKVG